MPENIVDSKFRILEPLAKLAGRSRYRASDLIRGRAAILESAGGEGFERNASRWKSDWEPALNNRAERFAMLPSFVPVMSVGSWSEGPYYVYAVDDEHAQHGMAPARLPSLDQLRMLLRDVHAANAGGDHLLNLRPEYLAWQGDRLMVLPGAWVLPFELLARIGVRSPYQPPELRHAGLFGSTTDGYMLAAVLGAIVDRSGAPPPEWMPAVSRMLALEPELRVTVGALVEDLKSPAALRAKTEPLRQSVERISDVRGGAFAPEEAAVLEALDAALQQLLEGRSTVLAVEGPEDGAGLKELFVRVRERLAFLTERPRVTWIEPLSAWEARDLAGDTGHVVLIPEDVPEDEQLLPLAAVPWERMRPFLAVVGVRRGKERPGHPDLASWVRSWCPVETTLRRESIASATQALPPPPTSPAGRHLLDLLCVLEADATASMLRKALPRQEASLPEAIVELERSGHVRRQLDSGGWWGPEPRLVLRSLRPDGLEARRAALSPERREELHLLISHLLEHADSQSLGQRYLRFHHLFAGGNWEEAATVADALLRVVERRGLEGLARFIQRKLVNSNLAQHLSLPRILDLLSRLGAWEVQHGRFAEGQSYFERASDRLFQLADSDAAEMDFHAMTAMVLAHADLLERRVGSGRAMEVLQRYIDRFGDRLGASDRGRIFSEQAYCEYRLGRFTQAEERCQVAIKLLDARQDAKDVGQVYNVLGLLRWRTSRYEEAEQYFLTCMALREKLGDKLGMARIYNNLGIVYCAMHRFPEALDFHHRSIAIRQDLGDAEGVARNLVNLGWAHFEMGHLEPAEEHARRAWRTSDELGIPSTRALAKGLLGEIFLQRGRMDEAREALDAAISGARSLGDIAELFTNLRRYASVELRSGRLEEAESRLREAEGYLSEAGSPLEEANWHLTHGELRQAQGDLRQAALSFEHAANNLARVGNTRRAADVFLNAADLYQKSGVDVRARDLVERARQLFARDGSGITPKRLVDLEVVLGTGSGAQAPAAQSDRFLEALCRVSALASTGADAERVLEPLLHEMRAVARARHVVLVGTDYVPHRASAIVHDAGVEPPAIQDHPRIVGRALQTLVPFGFEDVLEEKPARPFHVFPLSMADRVLGCIYIEWDVGAGPLDAAHPVLRAIAQQVALALDRNLRAGNAPEPVEHGGRVLPVITAPDENGLDAIVGRSSARQAVVEFVRHVRDLDQTVLLMGENGTGKEVVARAIHGTSGRREMPFISINCTAIPESLWERELFGNERGAFTDAHEARKGFFEAAHRGTLLLDEIGDMPWDTQAKFLRVLQDKMITRIGGTEAVRVDVRILAATNQNLEAAVTAGRFRRDLYHRLNVLALTLPPLRERRDDIPELAKHFLKKHAAAMGVRPKTLSGEALRILSRYSWPGNIRELEHATSGALVLSSRDVLAPEDLPVAVLRGRDSESTGDLSIEEVARWILDHAAYGKHAPLMPALERALAREAVTKWKEKTYAAQVLGISKPTLYTRIK